jgi:hypothetical protein
VAVVPSNRCRIGRSGRGTNLARKVNFKLVEKAGAECCDFSDFIA